MRKYAMSFSMDIFVRYTALNNTEYARVRESSVRSGAIAGGHVRQIRLNTTAESTNISTLNE